MSGARIGAAKRPSVCFLWRSKFYSLETFPLHVAGSECCGRVVEGLSRIATIISSAGRAGRSFWPSNMWVEQRHAAHSCPDRSSSIPFNCQRSVSDATAAIAGYSDHGSRQKTLHCRTDRGDTGKRRAMPFETSALNTRMVTHKGRRPLLASTSCRTTQCSLGSPRCRWRTPVQR